MTNAAWAMPRRRAAVPLRVMGVLGIMMISALTGHPARGADPDPRFAGARRMAERLRRITAETSPGRNVFMNAARVRYLEEAIRKTGTPTPALQMELALELLNSGRTDDAIALLTRLETMMKAQGLDRHSRPWIELRLRHAIASLRRAETDNCVEHHNPRSCLFPVQGAGSTARSAGRRPRWRSFWTCCATTRSNARPGGC